ncbi:MAG: hypothetical protein DRI57_17230, partial [Deltaproteobacteria bacterium]
MSNVRNRGAKKIKILTLEDGKNWCKYFKTIFDKRHYEIYPADRLEEAEEFLENEHIDIVIVNIKLFKKFPSDKSGIILLEHIKARYSGLPSIVFTAYSAEEFDKNGYIRKYVRCVLRKPSRMDDAGPLYREVLNVRREILNGDDVRGVLNGELMEYADFSLHIGPDGYIRAISEQGEASDKIFVKIPDDIQEYLKKIEKNETDAGNLKFCGKRLYDIVFPPKIHTLLSQSEAVARERKQKIRIRLTIEPDSLASLPWELTYREERGYFLSQNPSTVLSHYLDMPLQQNPMKRPESFLNMLLIIANPSDQTPLDPDKWEKIITSALYKQTEAGKIKIRTVKKATRKEISKALLEVQPDIVQFVGHGIYHEGKGYLAMVDNQTGETWKVDDERFSTMFLGADDLLRLVCLATCESAKSDSPKGFLGIAPQIVQKGIPAVVAMRYSILISTAEIFLEEFYQAIAERKPVDWAVQWARNQVSLDKGLDNREFATPVLFMRAKDGNIFSENIHRESPAMQDEERNV